MIKITITETDLDWAGVCAYWRARLRHMEAVGVEFDWTEDNAKFVWGWDPWMAAFATKVGLLPPPLSLAELDLSGGDLSPIAEIVRVDLTRTKLHGAHLYGKFLYNCPINGVVFRCANLIDAHITCNSDIVTNVDFRQIEAQRLRLRGYLHDCVFDGARMQWSDLSECVFCEGTTFRGTNLREAKVQDASFQGCDMRGVDLSGVDLSRTRHFMPTTLLGAKYNEATKWPTSPGRDDGMPAEHWVAATKTRYVNYV